MEIGRIRMLSERIEKIKTMLNDQIEEEFHKGFAFQAEPDTDQCDVQQLSEARDSFPFRGQPGTVLEYARLCQHTRSEKRGCGEISM
jgi:hypothetical protein